eukprot:559487-Pelagomonas_calceolata.AAC.1
MVFVKVGQLGQPGGALRCSGIADGCLGIECSFPIDSLQRLGAVDFGARTALKDGSGCKDGP